MWAGLESRKFPRIKANCKILIQDAGENKQVRSSTENIGAGGICVILDRALNKMSRVKLELDLHDGKNPIACVGRVAWAVRMRSFKTEEQGHDTGIEFIDLAPDHMMRIQELVKQASTLKK